MQKIYIKVDISLDHLKMKSDNKVVLIFHHASFLKAQRHRYVLVYNPIVSWRLS